MKCQSCGADLQGGKFCEFCGSRITYEMRREDEQLNKAGCPMCGSSGVTFNRETQGKYAKITGITTVRNTVGMCNDCGYTWVINAVQQPAQPAVRQTDRQPTTQPIYQQPVYQQPVYQQPLYQPQPYQQIAYGQSEHPQQAKQPKKKKHLLLWILGWIYCFPIPLAILIWRKIKK